MTDVQTRPEPRSRVDQPATADPARLGASCWRCGRARSRVSTRGLRQRTTAATAADAPTQQRPAPAGSTGDAGGGRRRPAARQSLATTGRHPGRGRQGPRRQGRTSSPSPRRAQFKAFSRSAPTGLRRQQGRRRHDQLPVPRQQVLHRGRLAERRPGHQARCRETKIKVNGDRSSLARRGQLAAGRTLTDRSAPCTISGRRPDAVAAATGLRSERSCRASVALGLLNRG